MNLDEIKTRMKDGRLYFSDNEELVKEQLKYLELLYDFNQTRPLEIEKRQRLLKNMFAEIGENCYIEPPLRANWGGKNVHFGNNVYVNFNLTLVDDAHIFVGDDTMIAPNVILAGGTHPISPEIRKKKGQYNLPVKIGKNVWIGAGCIVLPGVSIGDNTVIGAGSVVTKDIPENVVAVGNPCRILREINENDMKYYSSGRKIDI